MIGAILCSGGHRIDTVRTLPPMVLMCWQASLLGRWVEDKDTVPYVYACAFCFSKETSEDDYVAALGGIVASRPMGAV